MSYHVLARKWRPKKISDVVGQEHVLTVITNSLSLGRLHHAYFLSGTSGVGKTTIARILAKGMNCATSITASPCGQCDNCREIEQGRFVDLIEIDAASRTKVEDTRELLDNVQYAPARGRFKIYLIDEVHMLSRHSFNALLNTLEEPPAHVKFLLATTEPQKVPLTILSRCLQFHLKALDIEQICIQLTKVLQLEQIAAEPRALSLLARAANGSMRDALSLTDQAIAMGQGEIRTEAIRLMLGKLTTEQPLAIIEALLDADGSGMLAQIAQYAARGMNWEGLLIDILSLLHRLAMWQILPNKFNDEEDHGILSRLITVASRLHPEDLQLYYQTLLIGRKELSFAPDPRMGVEMTLLRALAFHPATVEVFTSHPQGETNKFSADTSPGSTSLMVTPSSTTPLAANTDDDQVAVSLCSEPQKIAAGHACHTRISPTPDDYYIRQNANGFNKAEIAIPENNSIAGVPPAAATVDKMVMQQPVHTAIDLNNTPDLSLAGDRPLLDTTTQLLHARTALLRSQEKKKVCTHPEQPTCQQAISKLARLAVVGERTPPCQMMIEGEKLMQQQANRPVTYHWRAKQHPNVESAPVTTTQKLRTKLEHEKKQEQALCLEVELLERDSWAAQVHRLVIPKLVQQLALNSWKEELAPGKICLHLRTSHNHLNSVTAQILLRDALSTDIGLPVILTVMEDDELANKTPMEWRKTIYEDKLMLARGKIMADAHIKMLQRLFDAELDEASIQPV